MRRNLWLGAAVGCRALPFLMLLLLSTPRASADDSRAGGSPLILSEGSVWRAHWTWMRPVCRAEGAKVSEIPSRWVEFVSRNTPYPPSDWADAGFDDSAWMRWREPRHPEVPLDKLPVRGQKDFIEKEPLTAQEWQDVGYLRSPQIGLICLRGKFMVEDLAKVKGLTLSLTYRGGIIVYVNGHEAGRSHLSATTGGKHDFGLPADDYPTNAFAFPPAKQNVPIGDYFLPEQFPSAYADLQQRARRYEVAISSSMLRKGLNVLGLEVHRAIFPGGTTEDRLWNTCWATRIALRGDGITASAGPPESPRVWVDSPLIRPTLSGYGSRESFGQGWCRMVTIPALGWGDPNEADATPLRLVVARNGAACGQLAVSSRKTIHGLRVEADGLTHKNGKSSIPARAVEIRYVRRGKQSPWITRMEMARAGVVPSWSSPEEMFLMDALLPEPPGTIEPVEEKKGRLLWTEGGAVQPVWIKVRVPKDATPGEYHGKVTVTAEGLKPTIVPVQLRVCNWTLPDPKDYRGFLAMMPSPDTLALYYNVPAWSDRHYKIMDKSFEYMGAAGSKFLCLPLAAYTWFGNEHGLIHFVEKNGGYEYDFKEFDRYVSMALRHMKPQVVCLYILGRGISVRNATTGELKVKIINEHMHSIEKLNADLWGPLLPKVKERLMERGIGESAIMLGLKGDAAHPPQETETFNRIRGDMKWAACVHVVNRNSGKDYGCAMVALGNTPAKEFGARDLPFICANYPRGGITINTRSWAPMGCHRVMMEYMMTKGWSGVGPLGTEFWPVLPVEKPARLVEGRFGRLGIARMDMEYGVPAYLAPGPEGPIPTARYEMMREGMQECQARILIEDALAADDSRRKLGGETVARCRAVIEERDACIRVAIVGDAFSNGDGWRWYAASGIEDRMGSLYEIAEEVRAKLNRK